MDFDALNTPAGKLVDNFLAACPNLGDGEPPFAANVAASTMRDTVIAASGRSGLIVRHRLIEHLSYFLLADPVWADAELVVPLLSDDSNALACAWAENPVCEGATRYWTRDAQARQRRTSRARDAKLSRLPSGRGMPPRLVGKPVAGDPLS
jgi:hypothetical protein